MESQVTSTEGCAAGRRLYGKVAVVIGAGQSPGEGVGNGRAAAIRFAREGARVVAVDRNLESAQETASIISAEGFECIAASADVTREEDLARVMQEAVQRWGSLDVLHNNVGVSIAGGDRDLMDITEEGFDNICRINLRGTVFACKHAVAIMREQGRGAIVNVSSSAAVGKYPYVAYKASKAGVVAFTEQLALQNAPFGIRANCVLPGLIATPMAVDTRVKEWGQSREQVTAERDAKVPLGRQGTGWDVANAALFLASDEANFVTGVSLLVDGGRILNRI
ncbi:SDR family NAD(P)-dependent oxidoreductase [Cupriavidus pinatubonensis]|uniref:SDR family NAD(P)-dependent oxidoreductase n=1 Tax=Cupriavidus pinatubonensis TaxID=248026 RepID=UPI0011275E13|nr:SDR family NAD(P)-dependent oxidoreductase [Cupriavidus pinatubonensis]TPQ40931.1 3-oxoacyl-ACP reductase [Cupriavidus pinatubonensis]